jgi:uncharacterized protein YcsI (UPF0317 family)
MARIKSESWRDIPPGHKKVTERLRIGIGHPASAPASASADAGAATSSPLRSLPALVDISDLIPRYGTYAHRAEMSEVRRIVDKWSEAVGEEMGRVLMS